MNGDAADLSQSIATYVSDLSVSDVPPDGLSRGKRSIIDTVGVMLAGLDEQPTALTSRLIRLHGGQGANHLFGGDTTASPMDAALVHGTASHALDFDDTSPAINGHPSSSLVPALLSISETENVTGETFLLSYLAGFEAQCHIAAPILESHYRAGWHTTATLGTFGATAATAKLLNLEPEEIEHALNIAASLASGLKKNFGSMTKSLHTGHAARSGVSASLLAKEGFTAAPGAVSGESGFIDMYGNKREGVSGLGNAIGDNLYIVESGIHLKKYPCCHYTHSAIEALIELLPDADIGENEIEQISVTVSPGAADAADIDIPTTPLEGKFSFPFLLSYSIVSGKITLDTFSEENLQDDRIQKLMEKVTVDVNENRSYGSLSSDVTIVSQDSDEYTIENAYAPGLSSINPLTKSELQDKFHMCSSRVLDDAAAEELWGSLWELRSLDDVFSPFEVLTE